MWEQRWGKRGAPAERQAVQLAGCDRSESHASRGFDELGLIHLSVETVAILPAYAASPAIQGAANTHCQRVRGAQGDVRHRLGQRDGFEAGFCFGGGCNA